MTRHPADHVEWARLHLRTPISTKGGDRLGWHLWKKPAFFPHQDMRPGFQYLITEDDGRTRATQMLATVTDAPGWIDVADLTDAYYTARRHFRLGMTLTDWLTNPYNLDHPGPCRLRMWSLNAQPIEPVLIEGPFRPGGWLQLDDGDPA